MAASKGVKVVEVKFVSMMYVVYNDSYKRARLTNIRNEEVNNALKGEKHVRKMRMLLNDCIFIGEFNNINEAAIAAIDNSPIDSSFTWDSFDTVFHPPTIWSAVKTGRIIIEVVSD